MPAFGLPRRSASSDADVGIVNKPTQQTTARQVRTTQDGGQEPIEQVDTAKLQFIDNLAGALQTKLKKAETNVIEQRKVEAHRRQGQETGINSIDDSKKRTGWQLGVFGQDVEYRAAQQRAVQNTVRDKYLEEAVSIDEHAGLSNEEYGERLKVGLDSALEPYPDDPETRAMITDAWAASTEKLAATHYKNHYTYTQQQNRATYSKEVQQTFDIFTVESGQVTDPTQRSNLLKGANDFFNGSTKPDNMAEGPWRGVVNEQLMNSLRNGNIGAYNAAKGNGWLETLNIAETVSMNRALSDYDTDFNQQGTLMWEQADLAAEQAQTPEEAIAIYSNLKASFNNLKTRASGTERSEITLTRGASTAAKGITSVQDAAEKVAKAAEIARLKGEKDYDDATKDQLDLILSTTKLAVAKADSTEEAIAIWENFHDSITEFEEKHSSGRTRISTDMVDAHLAEQAGIAAQEKIFKKAAEAAVKAKKEQDDWDALKEAHRETDPILRAGKLEKQSKAFTSKEMQTGLDMTIMEDVSRLLISEEPLDEVQTIQGILANPSIAASIASRTKNNETNSPLVKTMLETFLQGYQGVTDPESGQITEQGKIALTSIAQFAKDEGTFKDMVGQTNFDNYEILVRGSTVGQTVDQITKDIEAFEAYKSDKSAHAPDWQLNKGENKRDRVRKLVNQFGGGYPEGLTLGHYQEEFERALVIGKDDMKYAEDYLRKSVQNAAITYNGQSIINGKSLNDGKYSFTTLMDNVQELHGNASLMTPLLGQLGLKINTSDRTQPFTTSLDQVPGGVRIYTIDGTGGFYMDSRDAQQPIHVTEERMQQWESTIDLRNDRLRMIEEAEARLTAEEIVNTTLIGLVKGFSQNAAFQ